MSIKNSISYSLLGIIGLCSSCIENDIPYPHIEGVIQEFQVAGMKGEPTLNTQARTIDITIGEEVLIDSLPVTRLVANAESAIYPDSVACIKAANFPSFSFQTESDLPGNANTAINFTRPVRFLLKTYQEYVWTVSVKQEIERTIEVENQAGSPKIDEQNRVVIIYVTDEADFHDITIHKLNLEGAKTKLEPSIAEVTDFTRPRVFKAYRNGRYMGDWTVDVQHSNVPASVTSLNPWAKKVMLEGEMRSGTTPSLEYRVQGEEEWLEVDASAIEETGKTTFSATIAGLTDNTSYEVRALSNGEAGEPVTFQTEQIIQQIPNLNFDTWTLGDNGKTWYPNPVAVADDATNPQTYWATGNEGVTIYKESNTVPVEGKEAYKGKAARMHTYGDILLVGAAAGNLFIGTYKTNMGRPVESPSFGREYTGARPTRLSGYYKYTSKPISYNGSVPGNLKTDQCHIYLWLKDQAGNEIAYGEFVGSETVSEYTKFEFEIEYKDKKAKPAKMAIVATSSKYGGDFDEAGKKVIGQVGDGSTLWVDEFELGYE